MTRFIKKTVFFIIPVVAFLCMADYGLSRILKTSNLSENTVWRDVIDGNINANVAIYGSSRAWTILSPEIIGDTLHASVYNMGLDGHNLNLQLLRHTLYFKYNRKPKTIIHSIEIFTLQKRKDLYNPDQFLPYMLWDKSIREFTSGYEGYKTLDYYLPGARYYGKTTAMHNAYNVLAHPASNKPERIKGYQGIDEQWNDDFDNAQKQIEFYEAVLDTPTMIQFENYIKEITSSEINLVLVYAPEYIEGQKFIRNRQEIMNVFLTVSKKYNVPFIDYSNDQLCYDKAYFYNATHLNKKGSEIFSGRLASDVKKLLIGKQAG
ncbi:MAG: hypothetical protein V4658_12325 [Bacteroidota bacterium]